MLPFFVDTIDYQNIEKPGIDGSYIYLNCKEINFKLVKGDMISICAGTLNLYINDIENISPNRIFSHWRLKTALVTIHKKENYIDKLLLTWKSYFYKI